MELEIVDINDQIVCIDNGLLSTPGVGSTYVVRGDEIAIVETGTSHCAPNILAGLERLGIKPADVRHIVLTHIHVDHAGGAGSLLPSMPEAQVYIHSRTAKYLAEPNDLLVSAQRALGALFPLHGTMEPVPTERIVHADELTLDLGRGVVLEAVYSPGHSPDHLAYFERNSRCLFTGDSIGVRMERVRYAGPVTPPPAFNLRAQAETFDKLRAMPIETLLFSHYGPAQAAAATIAMEQERLNQLVELVRRQWEAGEVDHAAVIRDMLGRVPDESHEDFIGAGWVEMSVNGLVLTFERAARSA